MSNAWRLVSDRVRTRGEFGDLLLYLYLLTITRQCFWSVPSNPVAWLLSVLVALIFWIAYVATKEAEDSGPQLALWLVAGVPLLFVYLLRVVFPDVSFDVINHHLFLTERALHGPLLLPGDFFPTPAPYNPAPDMVTGLFRYLLGYRLGTLVNLLVLIWAGQVLDKLLRSYVLSAWLRAVCVLLCLLAEHLLFEINNYMVDLIALPLTLEATRLAIMASDWESYRRRLVRIAFLCGLAVTMKLTNAAMVAPIVIACAMFTVFKFRPQIKSLATTFVLTATAFVSSLLPYSIYIYRETGSPFFPVYNGVFKSPYWPISNTWDPRWGPKGAREVLSWPLTLLAHPERLSELNVYSGRITIAVCAALIFGLFYSRRGDLQTLSLCLIVLLSALLWSMTTGYLRYALHLEALSGALVIILAISLANKATWKANPVCLLLSTLLMLSLAVQVFFACVFISQKEWSMRATVFQNPGAYRKSAAYLLRDHSIRQFLTPEDKAMYDDVGLWIVSGVKTVGPQVMLKKDVPFVSVLLDEYIRSSRGPEKFKHAIQPGTYKNMRSLAFTEDFDLAVQALRVRDLEVGNVVDVEVPFFSPDHKIPMKFFEVRTRERVQARSIPVSLPDGGYRALITLKHKPTNLKPGAKEDLLINVKNTGNSIWPWRVERDWVGIVTAGDRWLSSDSRTAVNELDSRTALPHDLAPGQEVELRLTVTAPNEPGEYVLEIDMVHEGVTWFYQRGSQTIRWKVKVK